MSIFDFDITSLAVNENALVLAYLIEMIRTIIPDEFSSIQEAHERLGCMEKLTNQRHLIASGDFYNFAAIFEDGIGLNAEALLWKVLDEIDSTGDALKPETEEQYASAFDRVTRLCAIAAPIRKRACESWQRWEVIARTIDKKADAGRIHLDH